ncbi:MAG: hypothetical protein MJ106_06275 [Lentisphaeria bacterium]|nr:hypothetical protein [Lentisphaeria bacterium]
MALTEQERDAFIMECLDQGMSLSELQDQLVQQHDIHMTYMELRMLTADLQVNWSKQDAKAEAARAKNTPAAKAPSPAEPSDMQDADSAEEELPQEEDHSEPPSLPPEQQDNSLRGTTTVEISKVVRPGAAMSGTVKFGSGASGEWYLDQYGRLGFTPDEGSGNPDQQDVQEFQRELQKAMGY